MSITTREAAPLTYRLINTEESKQFMSSHGQLGDPFCFEYVHNYDMPTGSFGWKRLSLAADYEAIKDRCLLRLTDKLEYAVNMDDSKCKLKHCKYYVEVLDKGKRITVVGWNSLLLAIHFAYSRQRVTTRGMKKVIGMDFTSINHSFKILKPILEFVEDKQYNAITGSVCSKTPVYSKQKLLKLEPKIVTDEALYAIFKKEMDVLLSKARGTVTEWGSKSNSIGTLETCPGEELFLHMKKKTIPFSYVSECVDKNGFSPIVTAFPKPGNVKSDGTTRVIYPMNITYENALRRFFGNVDVDPEPYSFASGRDFGEPMQYFYDVKNCDKTMYGYIFRYGKEKKLLNILVPYVCDPAGGQSKFYYGYHQEQFPSGVYHTSLINRVFVKSLLIHLGVKEAVIQGDGFMTQVEILHDLVRRVEDFNGFAYTDKVWSYTRGFRLQEHKFYRGSGPEGAMRYLIAYRSYRYLGSNVVSRMGKCFKKNICEGYASCSECHTVIQDGEHVAEYDDYNFFRTVSELYSDCGRITKMCMDEENIGFDMRGNSWDSLKLEMVRAVPCKGKTKFPRFFLKDFN